MILFCYFQAKPIDQINFSFPWKETIDDIEADIHLVEADNHSEAYLIQQIAKMIIESEKTICFFDVSDTETLGTLSKAIEGLRKSKSPQTFFVKGENPKLNKILQMLKQPTMKLESADELKDELKLFINS